MAVKITILILLRFCLLCRLSLVTVVAVSCFNYIGRCKWFWLVLEGFRLFLIVIVLGHFRLFLTLVSTNHKSINQYRYNAVAICSDEQSQISSFSPSQTCLQFL